MTCVTTWGHFVEGLIGSFYIQKRIFFRITHSPPCDKRICTGILKGAVCLLPPESSTLFPPFL